MVKSIKRNYVGIIIVFLSFLYVPESRIYVVFAFVIYAIYLNTSNGIVLYLVYNAIGSYLGILVAVSVEGTNFYTVVETMSRLLSFGTMTSILDRIYFNWSASWTATTHFFVMVGFLFVAYVVHKKKFHFFSYEED